jgi:anti-sigma regulatory factor (Ser/Thr protein kinase)
MGEGGGCVAVTVVLCGGCGDVVPSSGACPTCGVPEPGRAGANATELLDEGLLDRVGEALAAQAALARRTAVERVALASRLYEETVVLQRRLCRQRALLHARAAARQELRPRLTEALHRVEGALESASGGGAARWTVTARLPRDRSCALVARGLLEGFAWRELGEQERENVMLVVSELVTNAFVHGQCAIALSVSRVEDVLRIEVCDEGRPGRIEVVPEEQRGDRGRGLWIVAQLARDWGAEQATGCVWAEVALGGAIRDG